MASTTIQFIENPRFAVDFTQYAKAQRPPLREIVGSVAYTAIALVGYVFIAAGRAASSTLSHSGTSFKYIVLGRYGLYSRVPTNLSLVVFKIIFWVMGMAWCFVTTTVRLTYARFGSSSSASLNHFVGELDPSHIRTNEIGIDVSGIPADVTLDDLLTMFDEIPERMKRSLNGATRGNLETFIEQVKGRVAFIGTPPAYDMPRLLAFYQQIEDAVRFSIHKVNRELGEFGEVNEGNRRKYEDLVENRARVAINLAIAGTACGARYMGEAMELYDACNQEVSLNRGALEDTLVEILAAKRKEIARAQIEQRFGQDTHSYGSYMGNLGHILAIPGTNNVIEHLTSTIDRTACLESFFQVYNTECVIETVQAKIKSSQVFREKVTDWLRDQVGDWNQMSAEELRVQVEEVQGYCREDRVSEDFETYRNFMKLREWLQGNLPEAGQNWEDFKRALFQKNITGTFQETEAAKRAMRGLFAQLEGLQEEIMAGRIPEVPAKLLELYRVSKIMRTKNIERDVALRIVRGEKSIEEALIEQHDRNRGSEFLPRLIDAETLAQEGLSPKLMEWVLVSQKILKSQV